MRIAVMQPYFVPYAGYWRLLAGVDLFVVYDCVQFPRRGWVHRNRLLDANGRLDWLTLPLRPAPFDARIDEVTFAEGAAARLAERSRAFPALAGGRTEIAEVFNAAAPAGRLVDYLDAQIGVVSTLFGFATRRLRSSSLRIERRFRGQDRILEICRRLGAKAYLNAPGGRDLYDERAFGEAGVTLHFLPAFEGGFESVVQRMAQEQIDDIAADIRRQTPVFGSSSRRPEA